MLGVADRLISCCYCCCHTEQQAGGVCLGCHTEQQAGGVCLGVLSLCEREPYWRLLLLVGLSYKFSCCFQPTTQQQDQGKEATAQHTHTTQHPLSSINQLNSTHVTSITAAPLTPALQDTETLKQRQQQAQSRACLSAVICCCLLTQLRSSSDRSALRRCCLERLTLTAHTAC